jgi:periplasmic copper chaperone A
MIHRSLLPLLALSAPAAAHIVFAEPQAAAGGYYAGFLRVSHGCGASPTTAVRVEIPAGIVSARPQPKPGWTLSIEREPLPKPITAEGGATITERVRSVTWTGTLPADQFDQFGLMLKLPDAAGPLYFPTRQTCASGSNAWTAIPVSPEAWHATPNPAPMLTVRAPEPAAHAHH